MHSSKLWRFAKPGQTVYGRSPAQDIISFPHFFEERQVLELQRQGRDDGVTT